MAKPSNTFTWATDATFSAGPRAGEATTVVPSAAEAAQGFVPGTPYPSEWSNYLLEIAGEWSEWSNTYAAGLELDNVFVGAVNSFEGALFSSGVTFQDSVDMSLQQVNVASTTFNGACTFAGLVDFDSDVNFNAEVHIYDQIELTSTGWIESLAMSPNSASRVAGPWKLSEAVSYLVYDGGVSGVTSYAADASLFLNPLGTQTVESIAVADNSAFFLIVTMSTWKNSVNVVSAYSHFHISGVATGGVLNLTVTNIITPGGFLDVSHGVVSSGLNILLQRTELAGIGGTVNTMISYDIRAGDLAQ